MYFSWFYLTTTHYGLRLRLATQATYVTLTLVLFQFHLAESKQCIINRELFFIFSKSSLDISLELQRTSEARPMLQLHHQLKDLVPRYPSFHLSRDVSGNHVASIHHLQSL